MSFLSTVKFLIGLPVISPFPTTTSPQSKAVSKKTITIYVISTENKNFLLLSRYYIHHSFVFHKFKLYPYYDIIPFAFLYNIKHIWSICDTLIYISIGQPIAKRQIRIPLGVFIKYNYSLSKWHYTSAKGRTCDSIWNSNLKNPLYFRFQICI